MGRTRWRARPCGSPAVAIKPVTVEAREPRKAVSRSQARKAAQAPKG